MGTPTLVYRPAVTIDFPDLDILGRRISPYVLDAENPDYVDMAVEYTLDDGDDYLALYLFLRQALPGEMADVMAEAGAVDLPAAVAALGLPVHFDHRDTNEMHLTLHSADLTLGIFVTSHDRAAVRAGFDFALSRLVPFFLRHG